MSGSTARPRDADVRMPPLLVALDALVPGDRLVDDVLMQIRSRPGLLLRAPFWLVRGRSAVRADVGASVTDPAHLPYDQGLLGRLREEHRGGRRLVLVTVDAAYGTAVARHLGLFEDVMTVETLDRPPAQEAVQTALATTAFEYLGYGRKRSQGGGGPTEPGAPLWKLLLTQVRAHQWLKNVLIFLPVLAGQQLTNRTVVIQAMLAFIAFSLIASTAYVLNDLLDLREDRRHASKRNRPFASGQLRLVWAPVLVVGMVCTAVVVSGLFLPAIFGLALAAYFILTLAYSLRLKGAVLIDVLTLAGLYTLRVLAGSAATGIEPSVWLLGFCMFFFLSLALVKRYAELQALGADSGRTSRLPGRGYQPGDLPVLVALGVGTGCMSVLVLALYVISDEFATHYTYPFLVWMLCPLALYWVGRAWLVVARDEMHDDPLIWAVRDQLSRWVIVGAVLLLLLAR